MIRHLIKIKKQRFERLKAPLVFESKRIRFLGTIDFDDVGDFDDEDEYEPDEEEYEDAEDELASEFFDFGI